MTIATGLAAGAGGGWRFVPAVIVAGLLVEVGLRLVPERWRVMLGSSGAALGLVAAVAATAAATTGIGWTPTLLIGVAVAAAVVGWTIGALLERHSFGRAPDSQLDAA